MGSTAIPSSLGTTVTAAIAALNSKSSGITYSTTETLTGDKWIDGKPIYRKVINFGTLPNKGGKQVNHGVENLDKFIKMWGFCYDLSNSYEANPLPYLNIDSLGYGAALMMTANKTIYIRDGYDLSRYTAYVVLEYTKK